MDIVGCARCEGDGHEQLEFKRLTHPVMLPMGNRPLTHWALCPENGEPILMMVGKKHPPEDCREDGQLG